MITIWAVFPSANGLLNHVIYIYYELVLLTKSESLVAHQTTQTHGKSEVQQSEG